MRLLLIMILLPVYSYSAAKPSTLDGKFRQLSSAQIADNMRHSAIDTLAVSKERFAVHLTRKPAYIRKPVFCQLPIQLRRTRKYRASENSFDHL